MSYRDTIDFISYYQETVEVDLIEEGTKTIPGTKLHAYGKLTIVGTVVMLKYFQWLEKLWICHSLMIEFLGYNRALKISAAIFKVECQGCSKLDLKIGGY